MLTLITGTPGAGKTNLALHEAVELARKDSRPLFVCGIRGLKAEAMPVEVRELERGDLWYECPPGSVIVLDEVQEWFRQRPQGSDVPLSVQKMERHRHDGIDIFLTTQAPTLVDINVRKLCGRHVHLKALAGRSTAKRYEYNEAQYAPTDPKVIRTAINVGPYKRPAEVFKWYESTALDSRTQRGKLPKKFLVLALIVLALFAWLGHVWWSGSFLNFGPDLEAASGSGDSGQFASAGGVAGLGDRVMGRRGDSEVLTPAQWSEAWRPRIRGLPWSAPAYDEVYKAETFPRPSCMILHDDSGGVGECRCYTQQVTRLTVSEDVCTAIVNRGWFDPTKSDRDREREAGRSDSGPPRASFNS